MTNSVIKLSVIIATYNGRESIGRCLDSFIHQTVSSDFYEVIIVDNNSNDGTGEFVSKYVITHKNFFLLSEPRQGVGHARNKGIIAARGDYICFIDDDAYADTRWLERVLNAFETIRPPPAVVGGKILPYYTSDKPVWFDDALEIRTAGDHPRFLSAGECPFGFPESNFCVRKAILDQVGGFSTELGPKADRIVYGEGIELSNRIARRYPYFWYDPKLVVHHLVPERNMSIKFILSRKFQTARCYQMFESVHAAAWQNIFTLLICTARIPVHVLFSILLVRWFTRRALSDWLTHFIPAVNCFSRSLYLAKRVSKCTVTK